jgi:hypothetical protein
MSWLPRDNNARSFFTLSASPLPDFGDLYLWKREQLKIPNKPTLHKRPYIKITIKVFCKSDPEFKSPAVSIVSKNCLPTNTVTEDTSSTPESCIADSSADSKRCEGDGFANTSRQRQLMPVEVYDSALQFIHLPTETDTLSLNTSQLGTLSMIGHRVVNVVHEPLQW